MFRKCLFIYLCFALLFLFFLLVSCSSENLVHEHNYSILKYNETKHYYECSCGEKNNIEEHNFNIVEKKQTELENGFIKSECSLCHYINETVTPSNQLKHILEYDFNYMPETPGIYHSWDYLWDDSYYNNYLIEYKEIDNYYLLYISKTLYDKSLDYLKNYENKDSFSKHDYLFESAKIDNYIDGKIVFAIQQLKINYNDMFVEEINNLNDISLIRNDYKLAMIISTKKLNLIKNISTNKELNKDITLYNRMIYNPSTKDIATSDQNFKYIGLAVESYNKNIENKNIVYSPKIGLDNYYINKRGYIVLHNDILCIILPRYLNKNNNYYDLLDSSSDLEEWEDVYKDKKEQFLNIFIANYDDIYGLYDFSSFCNIK